LTSVSIIEAVIAGYAGIVSTLSLVLARRANRTSGPIVAITWEYYDEKQELTLVVTNTGRAAVTVSDVELSIVRHRITRRTGNYYDLEMTSLADIPRKRWCPNQKISFPFRLASDSMFSMKVKSDGIRPLPSQIPLDEILLEFTARTPHGKQVAWVPDSIIKHFIASNSDTPFAPGRGSIPLS
jgi:hypothetical protein